MPDFNTLGNTIEGFVGPYQIPLMVMGGIALAVWVVLILRALQSYNQSDKAKLDQAIKHK